MAFENDFILFENGFTYYWPDGVAALTAHNLREIANKLDSINKDIEEAVAEQWG